MSRITIAILSAVLCAGACKLLLADPSSQPVTGGAVDALASQPNSAVLFGRDALQSFFGHLVDRTDENWHGDHWVHQRKGYDWVHANTSIYYVLQYAAMTGDVSRIDKIRQHYAYSKKTWWVTDPGCWINSDHEVMGNACTDLSIAEGLIAGGQFLPADLRAEMEADLRSSIRWLEHKTTGALNDADLRACNQDCVAAAAFVEAGRYFKEPAFTKMGLDRMRLILAKSQGPFWTEGGVDKGYQMVGEPPFALAADRLWENLTSDEQRRIADILMRPLAAPTLGMEKMRSESTLGREADGSLASCFLHRVKNPWIARDVQDTVRQRQELNKTWMYFDTPQVAYYSGVLENADFLKSFNQVPPSIGWGGTARLGMKLDEYGKRGSIDEKTYLTSPTGASALFGDISGWNPAYATAKRKATRSQSQFDPGGLRYVGKDRTVTVWADDTFDYPRLVFGDNVSANGSPKIMSEGMTPALVGSQYHLKQMLTRGDGSPAGEVDQQFVIVGNTLLCRFMPGTHKDIPNLRYEISLATSNPSLDKEKRTLRWMQSSLYAGDPASLQCVQVEGNNTLTVDRSPILPFVHNESIRHWVNTASVDYQNITPKDLCLGSVIASLSASSNWVAISNYAGVPNATHDVPELRKYDVGRCELILLRDGVDLHAVLAGNVDDRRNESSTVSFKMGDCKVVIDDPDPNMLQVVSMHRGKVFGAFAACKRLRVDEATLLSSSEPNMPIEASINCDAKSVVVNTGEVSVQVGMASTTGLSLTTGLPVRSAEPVSGRCFFPLKEN